MESFPPVKKTMKALIMSLPLVAALPVRGAPCPSRSDALDMMRARAWASALAPEHAKMQMRIVEVAGSADLGFSLVRWEEGDAARASVELLEVWKRTGECGWESVAAGRSVARGVRRDTDPKPAAPSSIPQDPSPSPSPDEPDAADRAISDFERVAEQNGAAAAMHVYAVDWGFHSSGFHLSIDAAPLTEGTGAASLYLGENPLLGAWRESSREHSADGSLIYTAGLLRDAHGRFQRRYLQIWQYDPKVANWGMRVLWVSAAQAR